MDVKQQYNTMLSWENKENYPSYPSYLEHCDLLLPSLSFPYAVSVYHKICMKQLIISVFSISNKYYSFRALSLKLMNGALDKKGKKGNIETIFIFLHKNISLTPYQNSQL